MSRQSSLFDCMIRFWSPSSNAFLFSWGPMSPTLYDIHLFTGLPLIGPDSPFLITDSSAPKLAPPRYCFPSYRAVVKQYESCPDEPSITEHIMFLWVLICQYLFCPISGKPSSEYLPERERRKRKGKEPFTIPNRFSVLAYYLVGSFNGGFFSTRLNSLFNDESAVFI
ncbi:hypothetical protein F511_22117 [Dorcoceras hygrometricum]|uniref:Uncharacterized protein n=1 Tax=Dorcoceras hygrometricum TaxID=472368 RepID=A0A2Z7AE87_9LAMI|nr:hypothetical protein F511_22117 [Dorcoceras hygrometricum]